MGVKKIIDRVSTEVETIFGHARKDKLYDSERTFATPAEAEAAFARAKAKLLDVNRWSDLSGLSARFELHDRHGRPTLEPASDVGQFIRILLPGPLPENWVEITDIQEEPHALQFTVHPCTDPQSNDEHVEHFFVKEASSTFRVEQKGTTLAAYEIGENEGINNKGKEAGARSALNTVISEGAWMAFQEIQWNKLTNYLVHNDEYEGRN
ncbi:hypothetical protein SAMN05421823_109178 [Catalinimonas alkaloidigena]|uniref:Uncharacterized protein n=1 Tax=Catalinimonas alkaloidigena TaxID=1075417 RepID=A0A1G9PH70_9BACT|nr:hypothetical protein [Catalinimonas alkaloidigena]SDL97495.1 hypothetical protein SAMN05421823_109178 [Catalinimonas alkaloidigena]